MNYRCNVCEFKVEDFKISGLAAPYNKLSQDMGGFREVIATDAFVDVLATNPSVIAVLDHSRESDKILGSTDSGTLELRSTDKGLEFTLDVAKTSLGLDVLELIKRGDLNKMSFAFTGAVDTWTNYGTETIRTINSIEQLNDVSIVKTPAYAETSVS
jgi:hypothetical protein